MLILPYKSETATGSGETIARYSHKDRNWTTCWNCRRKTGTKFLTRLRTCGQEDDEKLETELLDSQPKGQWFRQVHAQGQETAAYLEQAGVLGPDTDVIDIGCGPGRLSRSCPHRPSMVVGVDISHVPLELPVCFTKETGQMNTSFLVSDFHPIQGRGP